MIGRGLLLLVLLLGSTSSVRAAEKTADDEDSAVVAGQAVEILKTRCYNCHGVNFNGSAKFNVMDRDGLVEEEYINLDSASESMILERIRGGEMPPEDSGVAPLSEEEIETVARWIERGAPKTIEVKRSFKPQAGIIRDIYTNLSESDPDDRPFLRYFTLTHLNNNTKTVSDFDLRLYRAALSKVVNSLSFEPTIVVPKPIDKEETIYRVDTRDLGWTTEQWTALLDCYPYGIHFRNHSDRKLANFDDQIRKLSGCEMCWVRADWFIVAATRPPLYDSFLKIPHNVSQLEQRLNVDFEKNFLDNRLDRAGFATSGVSKGNRLVERHPAAFGYYWKSYDFKNGGNRGNLFRFPLGPSFDANEYEDVAFRHDGGEMIFSLPNGLQAYMLTDNVGNRIDKGPIEVVRDSLETGGTPEVVNGVSCMHCHRHGMIDFEDSVRDGAGIFDLAKRKLENLYPEPQEMDKLVNADRKRFLSAVKQAIGPFIQIGNDAQKPIEEFSEPVGAIARFYQRDLDLNAISSELGFDDPEELRQLIKSNRELVRFGLGPLVGSATIKRSDWESIDAFVSPFQETMRVLNRGTPVN